MNVSLIVKLNAKIASEFFTVNYVMTGIQKPYVDYIINVKNATIFIIYILNIFAARDTASHAMFSMIPIVAVLSSP